MRPSESRCSERSKDGTYRHELVWTKREEPTFTTVNEGTERRPRMVKKKKLGKPVRKYVCRKCGADDR